MQQWPCTHTVIQERPSRGNPALTGTCRSLEPRWLLPLEQPACPYSRMSPCLGSFWWLALRPPIADGHSVGYSQKQKGSRKLWQNSFTRVSVWHKLLASTLRGWWAMACGREGSFQSLCGWVPACSGDTGQGSILAQVWSVLEHRDENTYTLNAPWCFLAQAQVIAEDGRWFAGGRQCGDRLGLLLAAFRTYGMFARDCLGLSCFLILLLASAISFSS